MDTGRITERGKHRQLLAQKGLYRRLWDLQNQILSETEQQFPVSQI
jgi:ATP-binding cassette subfamily C protein CydC